MFKKKVLRGEDIEEHESPGTSKDLPALFEEVMQQKKVNEELELKLRAAHNALGRSDKASGLNGKVGWLGQQLTSRKMLVIIGALTLFTLLVLLIFISYQWHMMNVGSEELAELGKSQGLVRGIPVRGDPNAGGSDPLLKYYFNLGMSSDSKLQECQGPELKHSFPDLDYALLGYNILKGYPLAIGHDPGFTYPIFNADYRNGKQTGDCSYSIPEGFVVIPDVSCVTSFESKTVTTKYEFSKSLSVSSKASGGGWGVSFSASVGYKESSSVIASGKYVYILSTAKCNYYFSKLVQTAPPSFDDAFLTWIYRLDATDSKETYVRFFEIYGTHFPTYVTFGSRFTYEHKMQTSTYESEKNKDVDVEVSASYSSLFFSGSFSTSLETSYREKAARFSSLVTTKTITIGAAPPENGDALAWASTVKENPVPSSYTLVSIEELFTEDFMKSLNVDYQKIYKNIEKYKYEYCLYLRDKGELDSCENLSPGIVLETTKLTGHYDSVAATFAECIEHCIGQIMCEAVRFCITCRRGSVGYNTCYMFRTSSRPIIITATTSPDWESIVFDTKIRNQTLLTISDATIVGVERGFGNQTDSISSLFACYNQCVNDAHCVAYSYCTCPEKTVKCRLYSDGRISRLKKETGTTSYFRSTRHA